MPSPQQIYNVEDLTLNKSQYTVLVAHQKGYRINEEGNLVSPRGNIRKPALTGDHLEANIRLPGRKDGRLSLYKLAAYQKYGKKIFDETLQVGLIKKDPRNVRESNVMLGTPSEIAMLKSEEVRKRSASNPKFSIQTIKALRARYLQVRSYKKLEEEFGMSKCTISDLLKADLENQKFERPETPQARELKPNPSDESMVKYWEKNLRSMPIALKGRKQAHVAVLPPQQNKANVELLVDLGNRRKAAACMAKFCSEMKKCGLKKALRKFEKQLTQIKP